MAASLLPLAKQQFLDANGHPLGGGSVYMYVPATTTFKTTWQDSGQVTANTNPILLDSAGEALIYGNGDYRQVVKDALGNTIWDQLTSSSVATLAAGAVTDASVATPANPASGISNAKITYLAPFAGSVGRLKQSKDSDVVSVKDFGAKGDGSTDDTAAIQAAVTALQGTGTTLYFPAGNYKVSSQINISDSIGLRGDFRQGSIISWTSTTMNVLNVNSNNPILLQGLYFSGPANATAGAIVVLSGPTGVGNIWSIIRDCFFNQGHDHIVTINATDW